MNKVYDSFVEKNDKIARMDSLGMLRNVRYLNKGVVDQWGLVHVGLYCVRSTKREMWEKSFRSCNLHPCNRVSFTEWCRKIEDHLMAG